METDGMYELKGVFWGAQSYEENGSTFFDKKNDEYEWGWKSTEREIEVWLDKWNQERCE